MNFSSPRGGISAQFLGLTKALLEHLLALFSLAALETRELFIKILSSLLLVIVALFLLLIAYLFLTAALVAILILQYHLSWPMTLGAVALIHAGAAAFVIFLLRRCQTSYSPLTMTRLEIQRDIESLMNSSS
ncbi:MAG: phage holin family protein [Chthoniobacterales bacterium]|nr:phage holin family protein [Chthoniobacterales bacterium]